MPTLPRPFRGLLALACGALALAGLAQTSPVPPLAGPPPGTPVEIDFAEVYERIVTGDTVVQRLAGEVELRQGELFIYCDEATIRNEDYVRARGNVVLLQNDTLSLFADSMRYYADVRLAYLYGGVVLVNGRQRLFTEALRYDLAAERATYATRAKLTDGDAQLSSLWGLYDVRAKLATFRDSVFVVAPEFNLIADTLRFATEDRVVFFEGPTVMATPSSRVYCEDGYYDMRDSTGVFRQRAQVARGTQRFAADAIAFDGVRDEFELAGRARFADEARRAAGDTIRYNERTNRTRLSGAATFRDGDQTVTGDRIDYDGNTRQFGSQGRVNVSEPPFLLTADAIDFDDSTGLAHVRGNVVWRDTVDHRRIVAQEVVYRRATEYVKAYGGRPLFSTIVEDDSLHLAADTLISYRLAFADYAEAVRPRADTSAGTLATDTATLDLSGQGLEPLDTFASVPPVAPRLSDSASKPTTSGPSTRTSVDSAAARVAVDSLAGRPSAPRPSDSTAAETRPPDSVRLVLAYRDVRIYKSNLQAVADSMAMNSLDSTITLFSGPLLWSDTSQFLADTVAIKLRNRDIDRVYLRTRALIVNSPDEVFFNQVKGRQVDVEFAEGEVDRMLVRGNAESVYYILDEEDAYIGVNHVRAARMRLRFATGKLSDIYFYEQPEGQLEPIAPSGQEPKLLEDFRWETARRPRSKADLQ